MGRITAELERRSLADNTVIVFTSDHGFYLGEYGFAGKWYAHDVSIRVPMIVADPRLPAARHGTRRDEMVLNIDVAPTLLALAGLDVPRACKGKAWYRWSPAKRPRGEEFFYEHHFRHPRIPESEGVRTERWKYMRFDDSEPLYEELYDLSADPLEAHNLAASPDHAATLADMRAAGSGCGKR